MLALCFSSGHAVEIKYGENGWNTNDDGTGNYILTINDDTAGRFSWSLTVDPWNAEALGLFVDLGDTGPLATPVSLYNVTPTGEVSVYATDTSSGDCGPGCNINGLNDLVIPDPDGEWELVYRLGSQGFDQIQTFSWQTDNFGLTLDSFGLVAIRAQQLCDEGELLPDGSCGGSDKSFLPGPGTDPDPDPDPTVPAPTPLLLIGLGSLALGWTRRKAKR
jgi:hypothetical protein